MPVDAWNEAKAGAAREGQTLAEWLADTIRQRIERERNGVAIIPPTGAANRPDNRAIPPTLSPSEVEALARAMQTATEAAQIPLSKTAARHIVALASQHMRAARGLAAPKPPRRQRMISGTVDNPDIPPA